MILNRELTIIVFAHSSAGSLNAEVVLYVRTTSLGITFSANSENCVPKVEKSVIIEAQQSLIIVDLKSDNVLRSKPLEN